MSQNDIFEKLVKPFEYNEIEWKIQVEAKDRPSALVIPYMNSRAVQKRLDSVVGPYNWKNVFEPWQDKAQVCGISIYDEMKSEWVTKFDGADNSQIEPIKGGLSDAFKRAAVLWGIGRYLYDMEGCWIETEKRGNRSCIKNSEYSKLQAHYERFLHSNVISTRPSAPTPTMTNEHFFDQNIENNPGSEGFVMAQGSYKICSITPSGAKSSLVKLLSWENKNIEAYFGNQIQNIGIGRVIRNLSVEKKSTMNRTYYVVDKYEAVA